MLYARMWYYSHVLPYAHMHTYTSKHCALFRGAYACLIPDVFKRERCNAKILCTHLLTNIAWGQGLPVSVQGLAEDVVREEKLQLAAGRKTLQGERGFTIKDFKPKPLW